MNDWSYACMAKGLGNAIAEAAQRARVSATAAPPLGRLLASRLFQRCQQILDQVIEVLEPGRKADQSVADSELGTLLGASAAGAWWSSDA